MAKKRLDRLLVEKGFVQSRERARTMIMAGNVLVDTIPVDKPGSQVQEHAEISIRNKDIPFVSRGGLKLKAALDTMGLSVAGLKCLDVGASTGGFTDCLLQYGAAHVFAVDVGYGQLAWKLRQDHRVTVIERNNIRYLPKETIPCPVDLSAIDVSFISLKIVIPSILKFQKKDALIIALIKPQFEVGKGKIGKGGVVRDPIIHEQVIADLSAFFKSNGLSCGSIIPSPILGPKGNREFFISLNSK